MQRKWEVRRGGEWAPEATAPLLPFGFEAQHLIPDNSTVILQKY